MRNRIPRGRRLPVAGAPAADCPLPDNPLHKPRAGGRVLTGVPASAATRSPRRRALTPRPPSSLSLSLHVAVPGSNIPSNNVLSLWPGESLCSMPPVLLTDPPGTPALATHDTRTPRWSGGGRAGRLCPLQSAPGPRGARMQALGPLPPLLYKRRREARDVSRSARTPAPPVRGMDAGLLPPRL